MAMYAISAPTTGLKHAISILANASDAQLGDEVT